MTYSVSKRQWAGPVLTGLGVVHLSFSGWPQIRDMVHRGWWATADDPQAGEALWFAVAGGSLLTLGCATKNRELPLSAAVAFAITLGIAFTAAPSPGTAVGLGVGALLVMDTLKLSAVKQAN